MSTEIDLAAIKARVEAATPGPWERGNHYHVQGSAYCQCLPENGPLVGVDPHGSYGEMHIHRLPRAWMSEGIRSRDDATGGVDVVIETDEYGTMADADAEFIASAREDVPALVAEVERLRGEVAELKTSLVELQPSSAADRAERAERAAESTKRAHDALAAVIERVRQAVSNHPDPCEVHPDDDAVSCGWKIAYTDVVKALGGEAK